MTHAGNTSGSFTDNGKCFRKDIVQSFALLQTYFKFAGLGCQIGRAKTFHILFKTINLIYDYTNILDFFFVGVTKNFL